MTNAPHNLASLPSEVLEAIIANREHDDHEPASDVHEAKNALITLLNASLMADVKPTALIIDVTDDADLLKDVLFDGSPSDFLTTDGGAIDSQMDVCIMFNLTADEDRPEKVTIHVSTQRTEIVELSISSSWTDTSEFTELLESWKETLRHLRISCCGVIVETEISGLASEVFKRIRDDLELEVLELHSMDMFDGPGNRHTLFEAPVK